MTPEKVVIGDAELWWGDCREVLPALPQVDGIVTDPPYGKVKGVRNWTHLNSALYRVMHGDPWR